MSNEIDTIAKRQEDGQIEYICPICGGWDRLCEVYREFRPFIAHLIRDLCVMEHPMLQNPRIVDGEVWYQLPGTARLLAGLPNYSPEYPEWKELLEERRKIHPQAELFLPDISDWLEYALISLEELNAIRKSSIITAEILLTLVGTLDKKYEEQKEYLMEQKDKLEQTGIDPKWLAKPGNQARFVAHSMAGARWGLTTSSSREMIRIASKSQREAAFEKLKIPPRRFWWLPEQ